MLIDDGYLRGEMWHLRLLAGVLLGVFGVEWLAGRQDLGAAVVVVAAFWLAADLLYWATHRKRGPIQDAEADRVTDVDCPERPSREVRRG